MSTATTITDAFAAALEATFDLNVDKRGIDVNDAAATVLSPDGTDWTPVSGNKPVTGHELVRRLDTAHKRRKALERAIANTTALLAARMQEHLDRSNQ
jgi:hypothetical protein